MDKSKKIGSGHIYSIGKDNKTWSAHYTTVCIMTLQWQTFLATEKK